MELEGKTVLVVGLGDTGLETSKFLLQKGAKVTISERKGSQELGDSCRALISMGAQLEISGHTFKTFLNSDLIVVSPGVPMEIAPLQAAKKEGVEIVSEIELAYQYIRSPIIAVTGTNGKTTTVSLLADIFRESGKNIFLGGNIGPPLISYASLPQDKDFVLAEISSFQLEWIKEFRPGIAVLLNLTEDHLDRYPDFSSYIRAKKRIFDNQREKDLAILNGNDREVLKIARDIRSKKLFFSTNPQKEATLCLFQRDKIIFRNGKNSQEIYPLKEISLWGKQNYENVMAAIMVSRICGVDKEIIKTCLSRFVGLEHRCKLVKEIGEVSFYNDSKGTNVGATLRALQNFSYPLILIMGGKDKGGDYKILRQEIKKRVKSLIVLGEAKEKIYHALGDLIETFVARDLSEAVNYAYQNAVAGDKVLFSPACSSFDMFSDYKERGEVFKELVRAIKDD